MILGRDDLHFDNNFFAKRKWDVISFDDGEKLAIYCLWRPFENAFNKSVEQTGSTNDDLMEISGIGSHISASNKTLEEEEETGNGIL